MRILYDVEMYVNGEKLGSAIGVDELELFELTHSNAAVDEILWHVAHGCGEYTHRAYDSDGNHVRYEARESTAMISA